MANKDRREQFFKSPPSTRPESYQSRIITTKSKSHTANINTCTSKNCFCALTLRRATHPSAETQRAHKRESPKGGLLSPPPPPSLLPNPCAPAAFFWLDFLCGRRREGKREERRKDERKGRKEGAQSVAPRPHLLSPAVAGDLRYSCTPAEGESPQRARKKEKKQRDVWKGG